MKHHWLLHQVRQAVPVDYRLFVLVYYIKYPKICKRFYLGCELIQQTRTDLKRIGYEMPILPLSSQNFFIFWDDVGDFELLQLSRLDQIEN